MQRTIEPLTRGPEQAGAGSGRDPR